MTYILRITLGDKTNPIIREEKFASENSALSAKSHVVEQIQAFRNRDSMTKRDSIISTPSGKLTIEASEFIAADIYEDAGPVGFVRYH